MGEGLGEMNSVSYMYIHTYGQIRVKKSSGTRQHAFSVACIFGSQYN